MTEQELAQFESRETEKVNFKELFFKYLNYWYLFIVIGGISLSVAIFYIRYATPLYYISSSVLIKQDNKDLSGAVNQGPSFNMDIFRSTVNVDNEIELLKSRGLMKRALTRLSLTTSYYIKGRLKDVELYGEDAPFKVIINKLDTTMLGRYLILYVHDQNNFELEIGSEDLADGERTRHQFGQQIIKPYGVFTITTTDEGVAHFEKPIIILFNNIENLTESYASRLKVSQPNRLASVIYLSLTDPVPQKAVDLLNSIIEVYELEAIEDKNFVASHTIDFIDERLKYISTELTEVERDVEQYKRQYQITDISSQATLYMEEASQYNKQLTDLSVQISVLESIEDYISQQDNQYKLVPSSLTIQDPTLMALINTFNELQMKREVMLQTTRPSNPLILRLNEQMDNLQANILENLRNIKNSLTIARDNLEARSAQFGSQLQRVPGIERGLQEIGRLQSIKEALYLYMLQKREESAMSLAANVSNVRIVDLPIVQPYPVSPKKKQIFVLAFIAGIALPMLLIYLLDLINDKIQKKEELERLTKTPIIGEISHNSSKKTLVAESSNKEPIAEMFHHIKTNLGFSLIGDQKKVILITSSRSGEGKTFISINLGASLALTGKKVVLLGMDLRKPKLLEDLGLETDLQGITNFIISKEIKVEELVREAPNMPELKIIGAGPIPPNPSELIFSPRLVQLLGILKKSYDYILLDCPPLGEVADALALSAHADAMLYVIRYNYTYKSQVEIIDRIYREKKIKYPMIVLNDARQRLGSGYGYGYGYGKDSGKKRKKDKTKHQG